MRTRNRDVQQNDFTQKCRDTYRKYTHHPVPNTPGYATGPILIDSTATTRTEMGATELVYTRERIVDEVDADRRIKSVDHMKINVPQVKPVEHARAWPGVAGSNAEPYGPMQSYMLKGVTRDRDPITKAWNDLRSGAVMPLSVLPANDSKLLSVLGSVPPDRLGELPARLAAAIEEWHLMTTVAEASDYSHLMDLAKKRGPLRGSATELKNWQQSRSDFCRRYRSKTTRSTLWNLASAYRNGQLAYAFGIMPTVSEVRTVSEMLMNGVKPSQTRITRTLRGEKQVDKPPAFSTNADYLRATRKETIRIDRVDGVTADLKRPAIRNDSMRNMLNRLVGVSGARVIWDFVPWSFVVDWFLSVDDALDTLWLRSQTEYDIGFWSSTKMLYTREVSAYCMDVKEFFPSTARPYKPTDPVRVEYTHYVRSPRLMPTVIDSLRFRMGPKQGFYTTLLGLGLIPRRFVRKIKNLIV